MTSEPHREQQQPKEYIIDLTSLNPKDPIDERWADSFARSQSENIILNYRGKKIKMVISDDTRSRPHHAPLAKENLTVGMVMAYEAGLAEGARQAREDVLKIISDGKAALYEIEPDGQWDQILQAKMDVLCWIEGSLRHPSEQQEHREPRGYPITDWEAEQQEQPR